MATRFTISLPDRLNKDLEDVAGEDDEAKTDALKKAVSLYIAARRAARDGKKVGIAAPGTELATEFVGL